MRLGRMVTAALLGTAFAEYSRSSGSDWDLFLWCGAQQSKSKPNRVSQAKRRKYSVKVGEYGHRRSKAEYRKIRN